MEALYFSGAHRMLRPLLGGVGAILTLHHVRPARSDAFQPNRLLEVSPQFLEDVLRELRRSDVDIVTLDEMHRRLKEQDFRRRFVVRRWVSRQCAPCTVDSAQIRGTVRDLHSDQLSRPRWRIVVAHA
jgi:hypothetical protein